MTARLRQINPQNYRSSAQIHAEFEHVIRYLVAAERGNKTLAELLAVLFDEDGEFAGPIEFRLDVTNGLQYRIGSYPAPEDGWLNLAPIADLRGPAGTVTGTIEGPLFFNRVDFSPGAGDTTLSYTFSLDAVDVLVFVNGTLQASSGVYTSDAALGTIVFSTPFAGTETVTVISIRAQEATQYQRVDIAASASQAVFPFVHTENDVLMVYRNGVFQRPGGGFDYTTSPTSDTLTFTSSLSAGETVTIIVAENQALRGVSGLMLEDRWTDGSGFIDWPRIAVDDNEIPQAKVASLAPDLASRPRMTIGSASPVSPNSGDLWLSTATAPNVLYFYDGVSWWPTSPENAVPSYGTGNATQFLRVNPAGSALEWAEVDTSPLVPKTYMGAANGVPTLDSDGKLPTLQLPVIYSTGTMPLFASGSVTNGTLLLQRIYRNKIRIDGISAKVSAGSCTIQLSVDGALKGVPVTVTTTTNDVVFGTVFEVDGITSSRRIEIEVTAASSAEDLEVGVAFAAEGT